MRKRYKVKLFNSRIMLIIFLLAGISVGYSILNTTIFTKGQIKITGGIFTIQFENIHTINSSEEIVRIPLSGQVETTITPEEGYFLDIADCDNTYTISNIITGIESYNLTQNVTINNNGSPTTSICRFHSRMIRADEVGYTNNNINEMENVQEALDYLYNVLGFDEATIEAIMVAYTNEMHPEFQTVKDALDYLYDKGVN